MARPLRIDIQDGWYHVASRGTERCTIFADNKDRQHFLELLEKVVERFRIKLHAYVLMSNHYHLIVQTPDANLSKAVQWLNVSYSMWYNIRHNRIGSLFQGRFLSMPVENSVWGYELSLYIHLNPVMLTALGLGKRDRQAESRGYKEPSKEQVKRRVEELRKYKWSSYGAYAGYCKTPAWLATGILLGRASKESAKQRAKYRADVKYRLTQGVSEPFSERLKEKIALGAEGFVSKVKNSAKSGREVSEKNQLRHKISFDDVRKFVENESGKDYSEFVDQRGYWAKPLLLWGARLYGGMTLQELGDEIGGVDYSAISMMIKRFEEKAKRDSFVKSKMNLLKKVMLNVET